MENKYIIIKLAAVAGRAEAAHRSEMVTQLIFGERAQVLAQKDDWFEVENLADNYRCWIQRGTFEFLSDEDFTSIETHKKYLTYDPVSKLKLKGHEVLYVPCSAYLPFFDPDTNHGRIGNRHYTFEGNIVPAKQKLSPEKITVKAHKMLNAPYLWGGKTIFGIDCSGFVQAVYKASGLQLPRDAYQQAEVGKTIALPQAHAGDLAYFSNAEGRITHVGIVLDGGKIIHASGRVKLGKLDEKGIFDDEFNTYTHQLALVKRVIQ